MIPNAQALRKVTQL